MRKLSSLELARSINLRDLGGMAGKAGRRVKSRVLYRSAALVELSGTQVVALRALGIEAVIDLRDSSERMAHPTPWQDLGCRRYWASDDQIAPCGGLAALLADSSLTAAAARELMIRVYTALPYEHVAALQHLFRAVIDAESPVLVHCTSGKDRTGMAAALLLSALGVSREEILADYLASRTFEILRTPAFRRETQFSAERLNILRPLYSVSEKYLEAMFTSIDARDGSVEKFLSRALRLERSELAALRSRLLECS
jgi:protein-tyrosine phosphatase